MIPIKAKPSKMGNKKVTIDGIKLDSQREAKRYGELKLLERAGEISDLRTGVYFVLAPAAKLHGEKATKPALRYKADFVYMRNGEQIVEDAKGFQTPVYRTKKHLMKTVLGIDVIEV